MALTADEVGAVAAHVISDPSIRDTTLDIQTREASTHSSGQPPPDPGPRTPRRDLLPPLGVSAAIGVVLYFLGAVIAHVRAKEIAGIGGAAGILTLSAITLGVVATAV